MVLMLWDALMHGIYSASYLSQVFNNYRYTIVKLQSLRAFLNSLINSSVLKKYLKSTHRYLENFRRLPILRQSSKRDINYTAIQHKHRPLRFSSASTVVWTCCACSYYSKLNINLSLRESMSLWSGSVKPWIHYARRRQNAATAVLFIKYLNT